MKKGKNVHKNKSRIKGDIDKERRKMNKDEGEIKKTMKWKMN